MATISDAYDLFLRGAITLAQVESNGFRIDVAYVKTAMQKIDKEVADLQAAMRADKIYVRWEKAFGSKTKLSSRSQLGHVLFNLMGYPAPAFTEKSTDEKKRFKVDESVLQDIRIDFVQNLLHCEKLKKAKATNLMGILRETHDGIARPFYNLNIARSFRSSSSNFNSQNIPTRNEELSKLVRTAFIPRPGRVLLEVDFKGAEVSVSACVNKDPNLIKYVCDPKRDMHRDTAAQIFDLTIKEINKKIRQEIKADFVFAEFYGAWWKSCAPAIWKQIERQGLKTDDGRTLYEVLKEQGITELGEEYCRPDNKEDPPDYTFASRVRAVEKDFWNRRFRVYNEWKNDYFALYQQNGYFDFVTGFRATGIYSKKQVCNYSIQGPAFHCLLWSLIAMNDWLRKYKMRTLIIGQIHDSMLLDVPQNELDDVLYSINRIITKKLPAAWPWIIVPLVVEAEGSMENWFLKKPMKMAA